MIFARGAAAGRSMSKKYHTILMNRKVDDRMIKVRAFRCYHALKDDLPETQLENYIYRRYIKREQIISITSGRSEGTEIMYLCYEDTSGDRYV